MLEESDCSRLSVSDPPMLDVEGRGDTLLEAGRLTIAGPAAELLTDERVRRAYLG